MDVARAAERCPSGEGGHQTFLPRCFPYVGCSSVAEGRSEPPVPLMGKLRQDFLIFLSGQYHSNNEMFTEPPLGDQGLCKCQG